MSATIRRHESAMGDAASTTGLLPTRLANAVSDALHAAIESGMEPDEAVSVAAAVIADYGRVYYGDDYLPHLAKCITNAAGRALPETA